MTFVATRPVVEPLVRVVADGLRSQRLHVETGLVAAPMAVEYVNDGQLTPLLRD